MHFNNTGVGIYVNDIGNLQNNSLVEINSHGRIPQLHCLSGSSMSDVGYWIGPNGTNLNEVLNDPFDVVPGDENNPGELLISTPITNTQLENVHEGVYTCSMPDDNGINQNLHVGIYFNASEFFKIISESPCSDFFRS